MKKCFKCEEVKDLNCFYKHPAMSDGRVNKCKECNKKDVRENRAKKLEYYREYDAFRYRRDDKIKDRNKEYRLKMGSELNKIKYEYVKRNPEKRAARTILRRAVRDGRIIKPLTCSVCNRFTISRRLHAHHHDYGKPLDVVWMCVECHGYEHSKYKHLYKENT